MLRIILRLLALLLIVALPCAAEPSNVTGSADRAALELFESLFGEGAQEHLRSHPGGERPCAAFEVSAVQSFIDHHDVSESVRDYIRSNLRAGRPELPVTVESQHATVRYTTTDSDARHNVNPADVQALLAVFDAHYDKLKKGFGKILNTTGDKIIVEIYSFHELGGVLPQANGFTSFGENPIALRSGILSNPCLTSDVVAHELFHRVQYAHGLHRGGVIRARDQYFVEGMAEWATTWVTPTSTSFYGFIAGYLNIPSAKAFLDRDYDVAHFWLYLDERFRKFAPGKNSPGKIIDMILDAFDKKAATRSMEQVFQKGVAALVAVEDDASGRKSDPKFARVDQFFQSWHLANILKTLGVTNKKVGFKKYSSTDQCGKTAEFYPVSSDGGTSITDDRTTFTKTDSVPAGSARYYLFNIGSEVKKMKITVDSDNGPVVVTVLGASSGKLKLAQTSNEKENEFEFNIKPGTVDLIQVVVSARVSGTGESFTLEVNPQSLKGAWFDSATYINRVTVQEDKDNQIKGFYNGSSVENGGFTFTGSRTGDIITILLDSIESDYTLTFKFRLCPSGETLIGSATDAEGTIDGYWCRFPKGAKPFEFLCDEDPTCASVEPPQP